MIGKNVEVRKLERRVNNGNFKICVQSGKTETGWKHIEGSVYMSKSPISNIMVLNMLKKLKKEYPYLTKCFREIHQADVSKVHSLSKQFEYDGTPGRFAKPELTQKMKPKHRSR